MGGEKFSCFNFYTRGDFIEQLRYESDSNSQLGVLQRTVLTTGGTTLLQCPDRTGDEGGVNKEFMYFTVNNLEL